MNREMNHRRNMVMMLSACLLAVSLTAFCFAGYYSRVQFQMTGYLCREILERQPESRQAVMEALKGLEQYSETEPEKLLSSFGYRQSVFLKLYPGVLACAVLGTVFCTVCILLVIRRHDRRFQKRVLMLTDYLEKVSKQEETDFLLARLDGRSMEDDICSCLQDEIYKTVTTLYQTREEALQAKKNYAENLANIAHQLKTPITAISLSAQMIEEKASSGYTAGIRKQAERLAYLEESLLVLSRIDAGTLELKRNAADVFTLLTLASDHLQELAAQAGAGIDVLEMGEVSVNVDLDWTMEAVMNLIKNCVEHAPAGTMVCCSYEENPLYVQIRIWDEGEGFAEENLPYLFERFYCGKRGKKQGIGIGLALAEAIIEMQNGIISAYNRPEGGACFEIRFYCH